MKKPFCRRSALAALALGTLAQVGDAARLPGGGGIIEALRFVVPAVASRTVALWAVAIAVDTATMVAEATARQ